MWLVARNKPSFTPRWPSRKVFVHLLMVIPFWASEMGGPGVCGGVVRSAGTAKVAKSESFSPSINGLSILGE